MEKKMETIIYSLYAFSVYPTKMENHMEKNMENELETGV